MQSSEHHIHFENKLVTCGEYQPFIDDRREQSKYHQPDHWTIFQYPNGQANEPILGVRPSDALAFCDWLTGLAGGRPYYRIPTIQEAVENPMRPATQTPLGYWVTGIDRQTQFTWIGTAPDDARGLNLFRSISTAVERSIPNIFDQERARSRAFDLFRIFELNQSLERALDLNHDLALARQHARTYADALQLDHAPNLATTVDQTVDRDLDRALDLSAALDRASSERIRALEHARLHALMQALEYGRPIDRSIVIDLVIYIDLLTLQERIAGRSPAFEGVRVVQEMK